MHRKRLGKTDDWLSVVGFGGMVVNGVTEVEAARFVSEAIERGINYFDVAPTYGNAEERMGPALESHRTSVFLACKTIQRTAEAAEAELHRSLKRLRTDHFNLYQSHGVSSLEDVDQIMGAGGAMETFLKARDAGLIRYIGFSAHSEEAALRLLDMFPFDSVLFPINYACWLKGGFGPRLAARAVEKGTGLLALKSLARRPWRKDEKRTWPKCWYMPVDTPEEARAALGFTLSKGVTAAVLPSHAELLWLECDAAEALAEGLGTESLPPSVEGEPIFRAGA